MKNYKKYYNDVLEELKEKAIKHYKNNLISLVVFGSVAKDTFTPQSDIDLIFVLAKKKGNFENFSEYYDSVENKLNSLEKANKKGIYIRLSPIFKNKKDINFRLSYLWNNSFLILFDRSNFFKKFIVGLKKYEKENLIYHSYPMPYFEVKKW